VSDQNQLNDLDREIELAYFGSAPDTKLRRLSWELHCELIEIGIRRNWGLPNDRQVSTVDMNIYRRSK
jgi:hypothetical protein